MLFTLRMEMDDEAKERVRRLKAFCKRRHICLDDAGEVSPSELSKALTSKGVNGSYTYCRDILEMKYRSFGASKAREIEGALGMPHLCLDGGYDWPFESISFEKVDRLDPRKLSMLEAAILLAAGPLHIDIETPITENRKAA